MPPSKVPLITFVAPSAMEPVFAGTVVAEASVTDRAIVVATAATVPKAHHSFLDLRMIAGPFLPGQQTRTVKSVPNANQLHRRSQESPGRQECVFPRAFADHGDDLRIRAARWTPICSNYRPLSCTRGEIDRWRFRRCVAAVIALTMQRPRTPWRFHASPRRSPRRPAVGARAEPGPARSGGAQHPGHLRARLQRQRLELDHRDGGVPGGRLF